jgi:hypothetical protein
MKTAFLLASLALSSFALYGSSLAQDTSQPPAQSPDNNQPPAQSASLEDQVAQLERQQQVMQWQLDDLRKQVAALERAIDRLGQGNSPRAAESAPAPSPAQTTASSNEENEGKGGGNLNSYALFYTRLQSQGKWLQDPTYGYVWQPVQATEDQNWRPYTDGHWVYTDRGWTWVSNEDFGWACYHYGRWVRRSDTGWIWVPGNEWGPAWVSWRESEGQGQNNGYVGWAPLPPEAEVNQNVRIESWADNYYDIGPTAYAFVRIADLAQPSYRRVIVPPTENATIIANTRNVTNIHYTNKGFDVGGPDYTRLEQEANVRVPHYNLTYTTPERGEDFRTVVRGDQLEVFAPPPRLQAEAAARPEVARTLTRAAIDRGWRELNQTQAAELRQTFERQAPVPPGLPPSRVERATRTAAGEGTRPGQATGAPGQEGATPAQAVGAAPQERATPAQAVGTPAQGAAPPVRAEATPAQAEAAPAARTAVTPQGRTERPEAGATPVTRAEGRGQVAQPAETPNANRRNLTQESREGRTNGEVAASPTPSRAAGAVEPRTATGEGRAEPQRAATPSVARGNASPEPRTLTPENRQERDLERRPENENVRSGEPARTSRQVERPAEAERPAGNLPAREPSADTEKSRETLSREESAGGERHRPTPAGREQTLNMEERREAPKREAPATGTGEAERPRHEAGEQHTDRGSTPPTKHPEKENGASERESQHHEAAPAKHRADDEGKHHEGPAKPE